MIEYDIFYLGMAFVIGYMIGTIDVINFLFFTYVTLIWSARVTISYHAASIMIDDNSMIKPIYILTGEEISFFSDSKITFDYNWYRNEVYITRNFMAKIKVDNDKLEFIIKKYFNKVLCWDIFYQYKQLKIIYL